VNSAQQYHYAVHKLIIINTILPIAYARACAQFDYRNGNLRRKYDGIKYSVQRLEDIRFQLSLLSDSVFSTGASSSSSGSANGTHGDTTTAAPAPAPAAAASDGSNSGKAFELMGDRLLSDEFSAVREDMDAAYDR
jgi:hypothetical protein